MVKKKEKNKLTMRSNIRVELLSVKFRRFRSRASKERQARFVSVGCVVARRYIVVNARARDTRERYIDDVEAGSRRGVTGIPESLQHTRQI